MSKLYRRPCRKSLKTAANQWLKGLNVQKSTREGYQKSLNIVIRMIGNVLVKDIDDQLLDTLFNDLMLNAVLRGGTMGYSIKTRKNCKSVLRQFFRYLIKNSELNNVPDVAAIKLEPKLNESSNVTLPYSESILKIIHEFDLTEEERQVADIFEFNCSVGLRPSELVPLRATGYDDTAKSISIVKANVLGEEKVTKTPKSTRKVALCSRAAHIVEKHVKIATENEQGEIFLNPKTGKPWSSVRQLNHALMLIFVKCSLASEYRGIQPSRHTFVTKAFDGGMTLEQIASYIGHSSERVLEKHYLHWQSILRGKHEVDRLNSIFS